MDQSRGFGPAGLSLAAGEIAIKIIYWDSDSLFPAALESELADTGFRLEVGKTPDDPEAVLNSLLEAKLLLGELDRDFGSESLIAWLRRNLPGLLLLPVVSRPRLDGAVEAIRLGAADYLLKKNVSAADLARRVRELIAAPSADSHELIFRDVRMQRLLRLAEKAAASRATVLIQGESGTGKELLARFIQRHSPRADKALIAVNCAALPENLLESELFGFEKGAFTGALQRKIGKFEQADGGTLLLDELGEMALPLQSKLLRAIQEGEIDRLGGSRPVPVDVRIIATTNRDLKTEVAAGNFRQDLFFRLNVIPLTIPPLRERPADIEFLLEHFAVHYSRVNQRCYSGFSPEARRFLLQHEYPGNVRELENMVERAVVLGDGPRLELADFFVDPDHLPDVEQLPPLPADSRNDCLPDEPVTLAEMERRLIMKTLRQVDANRTHAAARLGISIRTLRNKLKEYREKDGAGESL